MGAACCGPDREELGNQELTSDQKIEWQKKKKEVNMVECIVKIQAVFRGYMDRKRAKKIRIEHDYMTLR